MSNFLNQLKSNSIDLYEFIAYIKNQKINHYFDLEYFSKKNKTPYQIKKISKSENITEKVLAKKMKNIIKDLKIFQKKSLNRYIFTYGDGKTCYQYKNKFQFVYMLKDFEEEDYSFSIEKKPLLLRYLYDGHPSSFIDTIRASNAQNEILLISNLVFDHKIEWLLTNEFIWAWAPNFSNKPIYCTECYFSNSKFIEALNKKYDGLLLPVEEYAEQEISSKNTEYDLLFDKFFILSEDDKQILLRACYWYAIAQKTISYSHSLAYQSFVNAIETLFDKPKEEDKAEAFDRIVKKYVQTKKDIKELYNIRSRITHGDRIFLKDKIGFSIGHDIERVEMTNKLDIINITKTILIGWMQDKANESYI